MYLIRFLKYEDLQNCALVHRDLFLEYGVLETVISKNLCGLLHLEFALSLGNHLGENRCHSYSPVLCLRLICTVFC